MSFIEPEDLVPGNRYRITLKLDQEDMFVTELEEQEFDATYVGTNLDDLEFVDASDESDPNEPVIIRYKDIEHATFEDLNFGPILKGGGKQRNKKSRKGRRIRKSRKGRRIRKSRKGRRIRK